MCVWLPVKIRALVNIIGLLKREPFEGVFLIAEIIQSEVCVSRKIFE